MYPKRRLLKRRGGVFYYRQRVPRALVPMLGRCEVQRSLRTADHREALLRAAVVELGLARRWRALLAMRGDVMRRLDQHQVERLAEEYYERLVAEDRAGRHAWRPIGQVPYGYVRIGRALLCILFWLPLPAAAMNDTDGLYGVGIFPIWRTGDASTLAIEREWVDILLGRDERRETRRYQIVNEGPAGHFEIGWICTVNALDRHEPCTRMSVDGRSVSLAFHNGLVRDPDFSDARFGKLERPPRVEVVVWKEGHSFARDDGTIETDGTIEGQSWASASIEFGAGQRRVLEVEQQRPLCSDYVDFVPDFRLHGERFFRHRAIPHVEFRFEIAGGSLDPKLFRLRADLVERSQVTSDDGAVVWSVRDYPVQETGEAGYYGRLLFDPGGSWEPWIERMRGVWQKAAGRSSPCGHEPDY